MINMTAFTMIHIHCNNKILIVDVMLIDIIRFFHYDPI